jgi:hypothetical protein
VNEKQFDVGWTEREFEFCARYSFCEIGQIEELTLAAASKRMTKNFQGFDGRNLIVAMEEVRGCHATREKKGDNPLFAVQAVCVQGSGGWGRSCQRS